MVINPTPIAHGLANSPPARYLRIDLVQAPVQSAHPALACHAGAGRTSVTKKPAASSRREGQP